MKKIFLLLSISFFSKEYLGNVKGVWTQKANLGWATSGAVAFSISGKGYIGTGSGPNQDFWEWDQGTNLWTQKANFGGGGRSMAAGFSIGNKGYIGTGLGTGFKNDFWEWDQLTNIWTQKKNYKNLDTDSLGITYAIVGAIGFSIGNKGFMATGEGNSFFKDLWEYDQATDLWTQKSDLPSSERDGAVGFSIGNKGYIGTGHYTGLYNDFWEWDQNTNLWTQKASLPAIGRYYAVGFSIASKGYIGTGYGIGGAPRMKDFYEWDQVSNIWSEVTNFPGGNRDLAVGFSIGNLGYVGTGKLQGSVQAQDFWEFDPITTNITAYNIFCDNSCFGSATVSVSLGNPPYSYLWNTTPQQATATATGLCPGTYKVTVTDARVSLIDSITIIGLSAPDSLPICMVSVDSSSKNNIILWDKSNLFNIDSFIIYREIATNNYQPIGAVPFDSLSLFVDTVRNLYFPNSGNPNAGSYRYKIKAVDSCGNYSSFSPYHNTIFINGINGIFSWAQPYAIENSANSVSAYILMRDDYANGNWYAVNSVSGYQQSITDPDYAAWQATARWRVETQWSISCSPTFKTFGQFTKSYSNIFGNTAVGIKENSDSMDRIRVFPVMSQGKYHIYFPHNNFQFKEIRIYNISGELVLKTNSMDDFFTVDISKESAGLYFFNFQCADLNKTGKLIKE